jgi:hypothetical protein
MVVGQVEKKKIKIFCDFLTNVAISAFLRAKKFYV